MDWQKHFPANLSWEEVDPGHHPFVADEAFALASRHLPGDGSPPVENWGDAITKDLVERYGRWACGWSWGSIDGGPVQEWCCAKHSLSTPEETARRVRAALSDWRAWIETLSARFDALAPRTGDDRTAAFERAAVELVTDVVERTGAGDAWYSHCAQVLSWYLERLGVAAEPALALVESAIAGRFESWIAPTPSVVSGIARDVAAGALRSHDVPPVGTKDSTRTDG